MNSFLQRVISCVAIGAIFTLLALASGQNYLLVALAFILGITCGWISADFNGFATAAKDRLAMMVQELRKTHFENRIGQLKREYYFSGLLLVGVWLGQSACVGKFLAYAFCPHQIIDEYPEFFNLVFVLFTGIALIVSGLMHKDPHPNHIGRDEFNFKNIVQKIRLCRHQRELLLTHWWIAVVILWPIQHGVSLVRSAHTDGRLVSSTCVAFGMVIGYTVGLKTDLLLFGTIAGGAGGALFALVDWYVLSVMLGWREKVSAPSPN